MALKVCTVRTTLMGASRILFCDDFEGFLFFFSVIIVNEHKTHSCVEEEKKEAFKIIAK